MRTSIRTARAVIGAGYGDEGKGLLTDALAARGGPDTLVVRYNGGAQAGHTVTAPDGRRHVFHHIGSGSFVGAATYLSRFFAVNPMFFVGEVAELAALGVRPRVMIDPAAPVTTPYDMMVNQFVEKARGKGRHGSCGAGFGETIERSHDPAFALTVASLGDRARVGAVLRRIRDAWLPARLQKLRCWPLDGADAAVVACDAILDHWLDDAEAMLGAANLHDIAVMAAAQEVIFEGAQGLMLDQDRGAFPHVTRSNTGLRNCLALARAAGIDAIDAVYGTRAYVTRHGAGPLAHETEGPPHAGIRDDTNIANPWQGALRFGTLDLDILAAAIRADLADAEGSGTEVTHDLAMTCLDQIGETAPYVEGGLLRQTSPECLASTAAQRVRARRLLTGYGPSRGTLETLGRGQASQQAEARRSSMAPAGTGGPHDSSASLVREPWRPTETQPATMCNSATPN